MVTGQKDKKTEDTKTETNANIEATPYMTEEVEADGNEAAEEMETMMESTEKESEPSIDTQNRLETSEMMKITFDSFNSGASLKRITIASYEALKGF